MVFASGFSWMHLLPGVGSDTSFLAEVGITHHHYTVFHTWLAAGALILLALLARMGLNRVMAREGLEKYHADGKLTFRTGAELFAEFILGLMTGVLSRKDAAAFFTLIATLFAYIFANNIMGIFPGFLPATDNANTNVGMAVIVFVVFMGVGLWRDPVNFLKHMMGPVLLMAPLIFVIEAISLVVRPVTLMIRLSGNIFGDHTVFAIMSDLVPWGVPAIFLGLAIFVSVVQALVFSLLTIIYISQSVPHHDHG